MRRVLPGAVAIVLVLSTAAFGTEGLSFGVMGGVNRSSFEFDYTSFSGFDADARVGFRAGVFAEYGPGGLFSIHLGLDYNERGYKTDVLVTPEYGGTEGHVETFSPYLQYVSIPLMVKARPELGQVEPFVMAGPRFDIRLGNSGDSDWGDLYDGFKETQWGMTVGGGAEVAVSPRLSVIFGVLYNLDFEDAYKTDLLTIKRGALDFVTGVRF